MAKKIFNKNAFFLALILILALFLRFGFDTVIYGYNYDEFALVSLSKLNVLAMLKAIATQDFHAPIYYFIIKIFTNFNNCDLFLRLLNILFSLFNIIVFYKIGKILYSRCFGLILALYFSIFHLDITISNFIKFYSFCFLITSLIFYYLILVLKLDRGYFRLALCNFLLILSSTFGFIFVIIEYICLFFYKKRKMPLKPLIIPVVGFILYSPILFIQTKTALNSLFSAHHNHGGFSIFSLFLFLSDYFSPFVNFSANVETIPSMSLVLNVIEGIYKNNFDYFSLFSFLLFSLIPCIVGVLGVITALNKEIIKKLITPIFLYFLFFIVISLFEITGFIPLYIYIFGLGLVIISFFGLYSIKNKKLSYILIFCLIFPSLFIKTSLSVLNREINYKIYGTIDEYIEKIDSKTPIIAINGGRFMKYYYKNHNIFALDFEQMQGIHDKKYINMILTNDEIKSVNKKNIKDIIKPYILADLKIPKLSLYLENELFSKVKKDEKIWLIFNLDEGEMILDKNLAKNYLEYDYSPHFKKTSLITQVRKYQKNDDDFLDEALTGRIIQSYILSNALLYIEKNFKRINVIKLYPSVGKKYLKEENNNQNYPQTLDIMELGEGGWYFIEYQKL